jgi:hypothetical protein
LLAASTKSGRAKNLAGGQKTGRRPEISLFGGDTLILVGKIKKPPDLASSSLKMKNAK